MKTFKVLPLAVAVAASVASYGAMAEATVEERLAALEKNVEHATQDLTFYGYARYGAHLSEGDSRYVDLGSTGKTAGRLGNEANGGEFGLSKKFYSDAGAVWNVNAFIEDWGNDQWGSSGGVNLKQFYAGVTNVFDSQPGMYLWAGRDFHGRLQQGLNDYYVSISDGQGFGFKNLDLGGATLDMGLVGQVDSDDGALGNDTGRYAATAQFNNVDLGFTKALFFGHFGFATSEANTPATEASQEWVYDKDKKDWVNKPVAATAEVKTEDETAFIVGTKMAVGSANLWLRYSDGAGSGNSVYSLSGDYQTTYVSLEGSIKASDKFIIDYLASYYDASGDDVEDGDGFNTERDEISLIARPMYQWNDVHSTWVELGYAQVDYDYLQKDGFDEEDAWKLTFSQNISLGGLPWSRPMLRFYATIGEKDQDSKTIDTQTFGAMFECWW